MEGIMDSIKWHLEKRNIDELFHYAKNPRKFTKEGLKTLSSSIDKIGFAQPINITLDNIILSGNARFEVLKSRGVKQVDVYVPNRQLTAKEQQEIVVRMNANEAGSWDFEALMEDFAFEDLEEWGLDDLNISFDNPEDDEEEEEMPKKREQKMYCCPNCGHVNVKKAFECANSNEY